MKKTISISIRVLTVLEEVTVRVNKKLTLGCGLLFFLFMFVVIGDVMGRHLLSQPIPGSLAIGENVLAFGIFLSLAYVLICGQHLKVTVLTERLPLKWQGRLETFGLFVGFLLMLLITLQSFPFALNSFKLKEKALDYPIPLYYGKFAYFLGCSVFCLQFLVQLLKQIGMRRTARAKDR